MPVLAHSAFLFPHRLHLPPICINLATTRIAVARPLFDMAPTPVKVKGKGGRKKAWKPPTLSQRLKINRGYGDPEDYHPNNPRSSSLQLLREHQREQRRLKRGLGAPIERLPVEILERIFHFSENVNFPMSSLYIGWKLSPASFLMELIIRAFGPTWSVWLGCATREVHSYIGWRTDSGRFGGDPKFQVSQSIPKQDLAETELLSRVPSLPAAG